jgi:hypothetical protein
MSKNIFAPSTDLQLSNLSQSRIAEGSKPQRDQAITLELNGSHGARLDVAAVVQDTPFETLVSVADAQPTSSEADRILPSAAAFHDASVDPLHHGLVPLALLGQEGKNGNLAAGVNHSLTPHQNAVVATPTITVPPPGSSATTVFEAGLGSRNGEPPGTHAGQPAFPTTTKSGAISFSSDGVQSVSLGGHLLSNVPQTFADGTTGTLTASYTFNAATGKGTITYTYSLLDNTLGVPSASFAVVVTDRDGETNPPVNLVIKIMDDAPVARADTDTLTPGLSTADGNVLTGAGTTPGIADLQGADGGMTIVGVAKGNGPGGDAPSTVGVPIDGAHGKLTLNADGTYTYVFTGGGGNDVFTYTIRDADGSFAHATLTINLGDAAPSNIVIPPANTPGQTQVFEAGLGPRGVEPAGSHAGDSSFPATTSGTITFTSPDGVSKVELGGHALTNAAQTFVDGTTGSLTASFAYDPATGQGVINYSYTLLDNTLGIPNRSFAVVVTDADGDSSDPANLVIDIVDDKPVAVANTDILVANQVANETGNVLTGAGTTSGTPDVQGADGTVQVVGLAAGDTGVDFIGTGPAFGAIGTFGILTLRGDGSYSYGRIGAGGGTDVFTYTIRDADGSLSHATLTITIEDSVPGSIVIPQPGDAGTVVWEAGLPARLLPAGSHTGDPSFPVTTSGTISFFSAEGVQTMELGGLVLFGFPGEPKTITDPTGSLTASFLYDPATGQGTISYTYTLLDSTQGNPFVNNGNTSVSFAVAVTDQDGDRAVGGNLTIDVMNDSPIALSDPDRVGATQTTPETGNLITGAGTTSGVADVRGADGGLRVVGVAAGNLGGSLDPLTVGAPIVGQSGRGTLTVFADGDYRFNPSGLADLDFSVFTYTIRDSDGSLSQATIRFTRLSGGGNLSVTRSEAVGDDSAGVPLTQGASHFLFNAPSESAAHIVDFRHGTDSIDVLLAGFTGLSGTGAVASTDFVTSDNASTADLGSAHFAYNTSSGELFYDSNGGDGASRILLAVFDNHAALAATDIHKV